MKKADTNTGEASSGPEAFALEQFLPYRLSLLSNTVSEGIATAYRAEHGLSVTEWRVVAILGRYPGLTASDVMHRGAMDKVAVSRAVARLDDKGLVRRTAQAEDRRRVALTLTNEGRALFRAVVPDALAYERRLLEDLSAGDRAELERLLSLLLERAEALNGSG